MLKTFLVSQGPFGFEALTALASTIRRRIVEANAVQPPPLTHTRIAHTHSDNSAHMHARP